MPSVLTDALLAGVDGSFKSELLEGSVEGALVGDPTDPVSGAPSVPDSIILANLEVVTDLGYFGDYYFRIWVFPFDIEVALTHIGVPIPFSIWSAYPALASNTLNTVIPVGTAGVTVTAIPTDVYTELEEKEETMTAPAGVVDTTYTFGFDTGSGTLHITSAPLLDTFILDIEPMGPVNERWEYNTDIMQAENATEQRVAIRQVPTRSIGYEGAVKSESDKRRVYNQLHKSVGKVTHVPYWQYNTTITVAATVSDTEIFCIPDKADIRDGDFILLTDSNMEDKHHVQVSSVLSDRLVLSIALPFNVDIGWFVFLTLPQIVADSPGITMSTVVGSMGVVATDSTPRGIFERPGASPSFTTLDGLTILIDPPSPGAQELFDINKEVLSAPTGVSNISSSWDRPLPHGIRTWIVKRNLTTMDYWRGFFGSIKGQQGSFLLPTWHEDLELSETPPDNYVAIKINDAEGIYESDYFPFATYKRIQLQTDGGIFYRNVSTVTDNFDGTYDLNLSLAVPSGADNRQISKISFLQLTRLGSDVVEWVHGTTSSVLSVTVRNIDS